MPAWGGGLCLRNQWNLVSQAVGAPSATGGSGWKGRGAEGSKSFTQLVFEAACMKDSFEGERRRLTEGSPPPSSSSWVPWLSASSPLCIDNERFKEQLRRVQAYLNVLKTKGDIATDSGDRNQFPICGFNFSKMGVKIRTEGTCKLPP